jgi:UDP:flavonoid glycosyltransferase YjiC (YdhE family)
MQPESTKELANAIEELKKKYHQKNIPIEKVLPNLYDRYFDLNVKIIKKEIQTFKQEKIELILTPVNVFTKISAHCVGIPFIILTSGVLTPPYFQSNLATFPDAFENVFTRYIPQIIKNRITNIYALRLKWATKTFNKLARHFNAKPVKRYLDLLRGDYTLIADEITFLNLKPTSSYPQQNYVGPIIPDYLFQNQNMEIDVKIKNHIKKPDRSILLSLGSSGAKQLFLDILDALSKTEYNVIAVYATILSEDEIPKLNDNILFAEFVPSIKSINEKVDLAIIHGGRGTVNTAAYSGKPIIGIPMQLEQQLNLDNLVRNGMAIRLSKKFFNKKHLMKAINEIFDNYDTYLNKAITLKKSLPEPNGAENTAKRIIEIIQHKKDL